MLFNKNILFYIEQNNKNVTIYNFDTHKKFSMKWLLFLYLQEMNSGNKLFLNENQQNFFDCKIDELYNEHILVDNAGAHLENIIRFSKDECLQYLQIELTNKCNFNCKHCYNTYTSLKQEIDIHLLKQTIINFKNQGGKELILTGGEPLLYTNLITLISFLKFEKIPFTILTNGWYLSEEIVKQLCKSTIINIQISVESDLATLHDEFRNKPNSFQRIIEAVDFLNIYKLSYSFAITLNKMNFDRLIHMKNFFDKIGKKYTFDYIIKQGNAIDNYDDIGISIDDYALAIENDAVYKTTDSQGNQSNTYCGFNKNLLYLTSSGLAKLCPSLPNTYNIGKISFTESITKLWNERNINMFNYKCKDYDACEYKSICCGGCRSRAYYLENDINGLDKVMCRLCKKNVI